MSKDQALAAIAHDFPGVPAQEPRSPDDSVTALELTVFKLNPGPGPGAIAFLFDKSSGRLVQVKVGWRSPPRPTEDERQAIANAGVRLQSYFAASPPRGCEQDRGRLVDGNTLVLYHAADAHQGFIELVAKGVRFSTGSGHETAPLPQGQASLTITYSAGEIGLGPSRK